MMETQTKARIEAAVRSKVQTDFLAYMVSRPSWRTARQIKAWGKGNEASRMAVLASQGHTPGNPLYPMPKGWIDAARRLISEELAWQERYQATIH